MDTSKIEIRYADLANTSCCLSCGGALNYSKPQKGEICVDFGSGRGTDVLRMAEEVGENGFAYGIDITQGMIDKAQKQAEKLGISNVEFIRSELEETPLGFESVDVVISNCTINHALNKQQVWNEIFRILKYGGRCIVSDIYAITEVPKEYSTNPDKIAECWAGAVTKHEYLQHLRNAGFIDIKIIEESAPYKKGEIEVSSLTIAARKEICCSC